MFRAVRSCSSRDAEKGRRTAKSLAVLFDSPRRKDRGRSLLPRRSGERDRRRRRRGMRAVARDRGAQIARQVRDERRLLRRDCSGVGRVRGRNLWLSPTQRLCRGYSIIRYTTCCDSTQEHRPPRFSPFGPAPVRVAGAASRPGRSETRTRGRVGSEGGYHGPPYSGE